MTDREFRSLKTRSLVWQKTDGKCWYCGIQTNPWEDFCIDHVVPRAENGTHEIDNLAPCCRACNSKKRSKPLEEFRAWLTQKSRMFSQEQIDYLHKYGIELPQEVYGGVSHQFWFEREGLSC